MKIGYARVSSNEQDLTIQLDALSECEKVFSEKVSGTSTSKREQLLLCMEFIREGDVLVVTRIDRLARSVKDLEGIVETLKAKGAGLQATEQSIDTTTPAGMAFFQMLGVFAQFETAIRRERQMEGIAKAKARGVYANRKRTIDRDKVKQLLAEGNTPSSVAKQLGISRMSIWRTQQEA
ncbi:recombinase family protein [Erythrobacteraceae bacterium WH01K]|nr:recombinase family protein [Erythrobacteraceae bacterium WH01K]